MVTLVIMTEIIITIILILIIIIIPIMQNLWEHPAEEETTGADASDLERFSLGTLIVRTVFIIVLLYQLYKLTRL